MSKQTSKQAMVSVRYFMNEYNEVIRVVGAKSAEHAKAIVVDQGYAESTKSVKPVDIEKLELGYGRLAVTELMAYELDY